MNLILDPYQHGPALYHSISRIGPTDYYTDPSRVGKAPYLYGYYTQLQINSLFNVPSKDLQIDPLNKEYTNIFIVISPSDMAWRSPNGDEVPDKPKYCIDYYLSILEGIPNWRSSKIFIVDDSDLSQPEKGFIERLGVTDYTVFKKSMSTLHTYPSNWVPFPYVYVGIHDPIYHLNSNKIKEETTRSDKVFWAGSMHSALKPDTNEFYNRAFWLNEFKNTHVDNFHLRNEPLGGYGTRCQKFMFAFYLRGWNDMTRRFVEILRAKSLMLVERSTINLGISDSFDNIFEPECYFSSLPELEANYEKLKNPAVYKYCMYRQNQIAELCFSYEAIEQRIRRYL